MAPELSRRHVKPLSTLIPIILHIKHLRPIVLVDLALSKPITRFNAGFNPVLLAFSFKGLVGYLESIAFKLRTSSSIMNLRQGNSGLTGSCNCVAILR